MAVLAIFQMTRTSVLRLCIYLYFKPILLEDKQISAVVIAIDARMGNGFEPYSQQWVVLNQEQSFGLIRSAAQKEYTLKLLQPWSLFAVRMEQYIKWEIVCLFVFIKRCCDLIFW